MTTNTLLHIKDAQGNPDMELVLTERPALLLRGAEILEQELEQTEHATANAISGAHLVTRLLKYLVNHQLEETEKAVERLAAGVPLSEIEEIGLDSSGFKIRLKGHGHPLIHLDLNAIDWLEACTFAQQVEAAQEQPGTA